MGSWKAIRFGAVSRPFSGFTQLKPDNGAPASQRTEVYFGFNRRSGSCRRGVSRKRPCRHHPSPTRVFQSDSFAMVLDTFGTGLAGMVFGTNPVGAEYDGQIADEFGGLELEHAMEGA